jgi:hypothetical protein
MFIVHVNDGRKSVFTWLDTIDRYKDTFLNRGLALCKRCLQTCSYNYCQS